MNTTEYFKRTIQAYLEERAMEDELFAAKYDNPDKNIDDCVTYILCLLYTSPSPRDVEESRMPSSA